MSNRLSHVPLLVASAALISLPGTAEADIWGKAGGPRAPTVERYVAASDLVFWQQTGEGVYITFESGTRWFRFNQLDGYKDVAYDADTGLSYVVGPTLQLTTSDEPGALVEFEGGLPTALEFGLNVAVSPDYVFVHGLDASDQARVFRAPHGGSTWTEITTGLVGTSFGEMFTVGGNLLLDAGGDGLQISTDAGANWAATGLTVDLVDFSVHPSSDTVIVLEPDAIHRNTSAGIAGSWDTQAPAPTAAGDFYTAVDIDDTSTVRVGTDRGELMVSDTWPTFANDQPVGGFASERADVPSAIGAIDAAHDAVLLGTLGFGTYRDLGSGFVAIPSGDDLNASQVLSVASIDDEDNQDIVWYGTRGGGIWATANGGFDIFPLNNGFGARDVWDIEMVTAELIYAATDNGVRVTEDQGDNWGAAGDGTLDGLTVLALAQAGDNLLAATADDIYVSDDSAATWDLASSAGGADRFAIAADGTVYAAIEGSLQESTDDGVNWSASSPAGVTGTIHRVWGYPGGVYLATSDGLFRSTDSGVTWDDITSDLNPGDNGLRIVGFLEDNNGTLYVSEDDSGDSIRFDGNTNWQNDKLVGTPVADAGRGVSATYRDAVVNNTIVFVGYGRYGSYRTVEVTPGDFALLSRTGSLIAMETDIGNFVNADVSEFNPDPLGAPGDVLFSLGFYDFEINAFPPGTKVTLFMDLPQGAAPDRFYKYGPEPGDDSDHWWSFAWDGDTGVTRDGRTLTIVFQDGGRGDADGVANGVIVDPFAPGYTVDRDPGGAAGGGGNALWLLALLPLALLRRRPR